MKNTIKATILIAMILCLTMVFTACEKNGEVTLPLYLANTSSSTYNLWIGHSSEISPANDVAAGNMNMWTVTLNAKGPKEDYMDRIDDKITVNVAQDGKKIATEKINVKQSYTDGMTLTIEWDGKSFSMK